MKNIELALRSLNQKGRHNYMKILSLAIGLAVGLILIAKVCFEKSYDDFYPDADRIYQIYEKYLQNGQLKEHAYVSGGVAVRMREMFPDIESATRLTFIAEGNFTLSDSKEKLKSESAAVTDSCLFDILERPILQGDPKETLSRPMYAMVSDEIAEKIGGDVIDKRFSFDSNENAVFTIGGVFKRFPKNSMFSNYDIFVSMPSIGKFMYDGSFNMVGNDRYNGLIKLKKGTDIKSVNDQIEKFIQTYLPVEEMEKAGVKMDYSFYPITDIHDKDSSVKSTVMMLSLVAFVIIFIAVLNYILIVVSSVIGRSKEMAVRKCYGASENKIRGIILSETSVHIFIAIILAVLLLFSLQGTVEKLLSTPISAMLLSKSVWILTGTCVSVLCLAGLFPASLYSRIPISAAFRNYRESKRIWKLTLLFLQFSIATLLVLLLLVMGRQYHLMVNENPGYDYENIAYIPVTAVSDTALRKDMLQELKRLPEISRITYSAELPFTGSSGDNVMLPGEDFELFNCADQYYVGDGFFDLMGINIIEGKTFNPALHIDEEIMISKSFAEKMERNAGWNDSPIGKQICVTSHNYKGKAQTICGVFEDYRIGTIVNNDTRPVALFYSPTIYWGYILIKFQELSPEAIQKVEVVLRNLVPDKEINVYLYKNELLNEYRGIKNFRDSLFIGGIVTFAIVFIGLIGYTTDEVNRRKKEIAIRRINGALIKDIEYEFLKDIFKIMILAITIGMLIAWKAATKWQEQFSDKAELSWYLFAAGALFVFCLITIVSAYNIKKVANDNPANSLKTE